MSQKRGMSKQQRLYYEQNNKDKVREELQEIMKHEKEINDKRVTVVTFDPHKNSYYNWHKYKNNKGTIGVNDFR